jgi:hypothetical protein
MQNFAAPFEPDSLPAMGMPGVTVHACQALLGAPLLQQLARCKSLMQAVTEETAAGAGRSACSLFHVVLRALREVQRQHQSGNTCSISAVQQARQAAVQHMLAFDLKHLVHVIQMS